MKIFEANYYIVHRGINREAILEHIANPNDTMLIIYATARDFVENYIDLEINSDWVAAYQIFDEMSNESLIEMTVQRLD